MKTLIISDLHIGSKGCKTEEILELLKDESFERYILVGDIIDGWLFKKYKKFTTKLCISKATSTSIRTVVYLHFTYLPGNQLSLCMCVCACVCVCLDRPIRTESEKCRYVKYAL